MDMDVSSVKWHKPFVLSFITPSHGGWTWNLASVGLAVSKKKKFENVESEGPWTKSMNDLDLLILYSFSWLHRPTSVLAVRIYTSVHLLCEWHIQVAEWPPGKELFIRFTARAFRRLLSIYVFSSYFPFGFEGRIWDLIVSVPDHCLSFSFDITDYNSFWKLHCFNFLFADSISKLFIWISAIVRSCAPQYVFLSTKSAVGVWSHYALEVFEKVVLTEYICTTTLFFLMVFEGTFKDVDFINMI